jgi:glutamate racemase
MPKILKYVHPGVRIVSQGEYVAGSLQSYLQRHTALEQRCSKGGTVHYLTTENPNTFREQAQIFLHETVDVEHVALDNQTV